MSDSANLEHKRRSRRLSDVNIDKLQRGLLTVLKREANHLLDESFEEKLSEDSAKSLVSYLKLLKQFQDQELAALEMLTEEELEARASTNHQK